MSLKHAFATIKRGVADITTVEVHTFVGEINAITDKDTKGSAINWTDLLEKAGAKGDVSLMAASRYELDGDAQQFINPRISPAVQAAHESAVNAGLEVRSALVESFYDVIDVSD